MPVIQAELTPLVSQEGTPVVVEPIELALSKNVDALHAKKQLREDGTSPNFGNRSKPWPCV